MTRPPILRLTRESVVYGLGQAIGRGLQMVLVPVFTRAFRPAEYGVIDVLALIATIAALVIVMGTDSALGRFFYEGDDADARRTLVSTLAGWRASLSVGVALLLFLLAPTLSRFVLASPDYAKYVRVTAGTLPFTVFVLFQNDVLRATFQPAKFIALNLLNTLCVGGLSIFFVIGMHEGVVGALYGRLIGDAITAVVGFVLIRHYLRLRFDRARLVRLLGFAAPLVPAVLFFWAVSYADRWVLVHFTNLDEVGVYAVAVKISTLVLLGVSAFQLAWGPFAYSHAKDPDSARTFSRVLTLYAAGASLVALAIGLFAPEGLRLIVPAAYRGAALPGAILAFGAAAYGAYAIVGIGANLAYRPGLQAWACIAAGVVTVALALALVGPFRLMGVAVATLVGMVTAGVVLYFSSQSVYPLPYRALRAALLFGSAVTVWALAAWGAGALERGGRYALGLALRVVLLLAFAAVVRHVARRMPTPPAPAAGLATAAGPGGL